MYMLSKKFPDDLYTNGGKFPYYIVSKTRFQTKFHRICGYGNGRTDLKDKMDVRPWILAVIFSYLSKGDTKLNGTSIEDIKNIPSVKQFINEGDDIKRVLYNIIKSLEKEPQNRTFVNPKNYHEDFDTASPENFIDFQNENVSNEDNSSEEYAGNVSNEDDSSEEYSTKNPLINKNHIKNRLSDPENSDTLFQKNIEQHNLKKPYSDIYNDIYRVLFGDVNSDGVKDIFIVKGTSKDKDSVPFSYKDKKYALIFDTSLQKEIVKLNDKRIRRLVSRTILAAEKTVKFM